MTQPLRRDESIAAPETRARTQGDRAGAGERVVHADGAAALLPGSVHPSQPLQRQSRVQRRQGSAARALPLRLRQMVESWRSAGINMDSVVPQGWNRFETEDHAGDFSTFLGNLRKTSIYMNEESMPDVQQRVNCLLAQLEAPDRGALRALCFLEANEVVKSCGDGTAMALVRMETACSIEEVESDIRAGKYDDGASTSETNPASLWKLAKGMYRLLRVEEMAHQKTTLEKLGDTIEVHLGFLCRLAQTFELPIRMQTMLYYDTSQIKDAEITNAIAVLQEDGAAWHEFLAGWGPLDALLQRRDPHGHAALGARVAAEIATRKDDLRAQCEAIYDVLERLDVDAPDHKPRRTALEAKMRTLGDSVNHLEAQVRAELKEPVIAAFAAKYELDTSLILAASPPPPRG